MSTNSIILILLGIIIFEFGIIVLDTIINNKALKEMVDIYSETLCYIRKENKNKNENLPD